MASALELLLRVGGDATGAGQALDQTKSGLQRLISPANLVKGVIMGAGIAVAKLAADVTPLNQANDRLAVSTGLAREEIRALTLELTNVTFPIEDVQKGMERLIQSGINTEEQFRSLLPVFDTFSDATGKDIVQSIDIFDRVLSALGIPLEEAGEHLDTMTFLTTQTTVELNNLAMLMRREAPTLKDMGLSVDDIAVAMAALEAEGRRGPRAVMGFQEALKDAEGDVDAFWQALGVTNDTLEEQRRRLGDAAGMTEEFAEINTRHLGLWAEMRQRFKELTFEYGEQIETLGQFGLVLTGATPLLRSLGKGLASVGGLARTALVPGIVGATKAAWGFTAALLANPITWIVLLIAGLVVAIWYLWKNWDEVSAWLVEKWEWVKEKVGDAIEAVINWFGEMPGRVWEYLKDLYNRADKWSEDLKKRVTDGAKSAVEGVIDWISRLPVRVWEWLVRTVQRIIEWRSDMINRARDAARGAFDVITNTLSGLPSRLLSLGRDMISNLASGIRNAAATTLSNAVDNVMSFLNRINPFARHSPSLVDQVWAGVEEIERAYKSLDLPDMQIAPIIAGEMRQPAASMRTEMFNFERMFDGANFYVRKDTDARLIAKEIHDLFRGTARGLGVSTI